jgi:hypothetical protein
VVAELARHAGRGVLAVARWSAPRLRSAGRWGWLALRALGRAAACVGRHAAARRGALLAVATRAAWWAALGLLWLGGTALLDVTRPFDRAGLTTSFGVGLGLCLFAVLLASHRRIRWAGWSLGLAHGALGLLTMIAAT